MKKSIPATPVIILLLLLLPFCRQKPAPPQIEESLLGEWYTIKGDVDAYSFLKDENSYIFTGMQGTRPVIYGSWEIARDLFVITMDNGTTTSYTWELDNDTLIFNSGQEVYTRTTPLDIRFPEVRILLDLKSDLGLSFCAPSETEIRWGKWISDSIPPREMTLKGFSISAGSTLPSDDLGKITGLLTNYGFERDTMIISETCSGFWDNTHLVTVCSLQDSSSINKSVNIIISSGFLRE